MYNRTMGNEKPPFQGGEKNSSVFDLKKIHAIGGAFCKSVKRTDEIDGVRIFRSVIETRTDAPYEHDKRILGKSTVRFAIGSVSKSKVCY